MADKMNKIVDAEKLVRLTKALDTRMVTKIKVEQERALEKEESLKEDITKVREMLGGRSLVYLTQNEFDNLTEEEKNNNEKNYFIVDLEDLSHSHANKEFLDTLDAELFESINAKITALEEQVDSLIELNTVAEVSVIDGVLTLENNKHQICNNMESRTEVRFPTIENNKYTELHLYFNSTSDIDLVFPEDCKWRLDPNLNEGTSYELIATYNTIQWLVNIIVYS